MHTMHKTDKTTMARNGDGTGHRKIGEKAANPVSSGKESINNM